MVAAEKLECSQFDVKNALTESHIAAASPLNVLGTEAPSDVLSSAS
jgi:hypothetical protein